MKKSVKENSSTNYVKLHPLSLKHLAKGHPWIIKDQYTERFPSKQHLLHVSHQGKQFTLLHDSKHPEIKARLWHGQSSSWEHFDRELESRLQSAFSKRNSIHDRENFYLLFGEADYVPGLFIQWLKEGILIQSYSSFWKRMQKTLVPLIRQLLEGRELKWVLWQDRDHIRENNLKPLWGKVPDDILLTEYGVNYKVAFNQGYDIGLYSDMSSLRKKYRASFQGKKVLNLYSYTGAWSLFALKQGAESVTSVDLSRPYLDWLLENLKLNNFTAHHDLCMDTYSALKLLLKQEQSFDIIVCDPPSFSSDGEKATPAMSAYKTILPLCEELLSPKGRMLCFLNTHRITREKYRQKVQSYQHNLKIIGENGLGDDCPTLEGFPEGDYLKCLELEKRNDR